MTKQEFTQLVGKDVTDEQYKDIELVYMYYPGIKTKAIIAELYKNFGMRIIQDMLPTAKKGYEYEEQIRCLELEIIEKNKQLDELKKKYYQEFL